MIIVLICISLIISDVVHLFNVLFGHLYVKGTVNEMRSQATDRGKILAICISYKDLFFRRHKELIQINNTKRNNLSF